MESATTSLNDVYEYTVPMFGKNGEPLVPSYRCRCCLQEAQRPYPVKHLDSCEFAKQFNIVYEEQLNHV